MSDQPVPEKMDEAETKVATATETAAKHAIVTEGENQETRQLQEIAAPESESKDEQMTELPEDKADKVMSQPINEDGVSIERLYELCETLDSMSKTNSDKMSSYEDVYQELLIGVKGQEKKQKQLSCQFIMRFFKYFSGSEKLLEETLDALFDLCEDNDPAIRRQAIKELPNICKTVPSTVARISDILAQLLQAEDSIEYAVVQSSLLQLVKIDTKNCLMTLFVQILSANESGGEVIRERTIKFLATKLPSLSPEIMTNEIENFLITKIQDTLSDVTGQEFGTFIKILSSLRQLQQTEGRTRLIEIIANQAGISDDSNSDFDPKNDEQVAILVQCTKQALDFFSRSIPSTKFTTYFCSTVLPRLWELPENDSENSGIPTQVDVLKLLAELSTTSGQLDNLCIEHVYNALVRLLPEKPTEENTKSSELPNLMLSHLECVVFTFHTLARQPSYITCEETKNNLKKLRPILTLVTTKLQNYIKKLRADISECSQEELKETQNSIKLTALKVTLNITVILKELSRSPPSFQEIVNLSWKRATQAAATKAAVKRKSQHDSRRGQAESREDGTSDGRGQRYNPPSGKYSKQVNSYESNYRPGFKGTKYKLGVYYA